ncbi:uncharacterized protein SAPINGB_P006351 [Magnusiomyces paraingens]|uniref:Uncharacterized protein n=1 Tax=Magnusiomyces paraingens TaxID=2606893 RepID=A0A5E8C5P1_9ASCO|nr:uncharacterized protein SAPINGB_P006351 [Saprochaete ingens]VVT58722.1 unnamed protein product [Saprochaete ingens]
MIAAPIRTSLATSVRVAVPMATRAISTSRIISTAANPKVKANDVSHFKTFKEYRVFAQQFGPLASLAWQNNISSQPAAAAVAAAAAAASSQVAEALESSILFNESESETIILGGASD